MIANTAAKACYIALLMSRMRMSRVCTMIVHMWFIYIAGKPVPQLCLADIARMDIWIRHIWVCVEY